MEELKLSKKHKIKFEIFEKECLKWIDFFGLKSWDIYIGFTSNDDDFWAMSWPNYEAKNSAIRINLRLIDEMQIKEIRQAAFHEVCETMFGGVYHVAESRNFDEKQINQVVHDIIRTLENVIFRKK